MGLEQYFPNVFLFAVYSCLRKITTDPHILAHVNIVCPDDRYPKLNIYVSELILGSYECIPATYVILHCMFGP